MDVHAITDEFRPAPGGVKGRAHYTGRPVRKGRHGVEQMGSLTRTGGIGCHSSVIIGRRMGDGDRHLVGDFPDELQRARLLRRNRHQLHKALRSLLQTAEHGHIGRMEPLPVLGALFGTGQEGTFQIHAAQQRTALAGPAVFRRIPAHLDELFLQQGHACRTDLCHTAGELIVSHDLQALGIGVTEIMALRTVKVYIREAGDQIIAGEVGGLSVGAPLPDQLSVDAHVPGDEALLDVIDLRAGQPHTGTPASTSLLRASLSPTRVTSGWSWRMEAGTSRFTGPQKAL